MNPLNVGGSRLHRCILICFCVALLVLFLELSSAFILKNVVSPTRLERFDALFLSEGLSSELYIPHPYLGWLYDRTITEIERYLSYIGKDRTNKVYVAALGGSTTADGYPAYTEAYLDKRLKEVNSTLDAVVFNFGVGSWDSLRSVQLYFYTLKYLHPDFVVIHHNVNDHPVTFVFDPTSSTALSRDPMALHIQDSVINYPQIGPLEKGLLRASRFYKLLRFVSLSGYNLIHYGRQISQDEQITNYPMASRISSYLNEEHPTRSVAADYFMVNYANRNFSTLPFLGLEFLLRENYESLIRYTKADNTTLVLTTQYANFSKLPPRIKVDRIIEDAVSDEINDLIRQLSRTHGLPLVDLAAEMETHDPLLVDGIHFTEEGVQLKGELVGEAIFEIIKERYNLSG